MTEAPRSSRSGSRIRLPTTTAGKSPSVPWPSQAGDFGLLYIGRRRSGGDPYNYAQNLKSVFGEILRIDPLGHNSANGQYGIPSSNPFAKNPDALGEVYSYGHRNPQRFPWDL